MLEKIPVQLIRSLKVGAVGTALTIGLPGLWNYTANDQVYIDTGDTLYLRKRDGWIAHAQIDLSYSRNDVIVTVFDPFGEGSRKYSDSNRDGILDEVKIDSSLFQVSGPSGSFNRKENLSTHPELFLQENQRYQQHLQEFGKQFPQQMKRLGLDKILTP